MSIDSITSSDIAANNPLMSRPPSRRGEQRLNISRLQNLDQVELSAVAQTTLQGRNTGGAASRQAREVTTLRQYAQSAQVSFSFKTRQGDEIQVSLSKGLAFGTQTGDSAAASEGYQLIIDNSIQIQVQGDLNKAELAAIGDFVQAGMDLFDEFRQTRPDKLLEKLQRLGINEEQISEFSMQLRQVEQYRALQVYQRISAMAQSPAEAVRESIVPIADYAEHLLALVEGTRLRLAGQQDSLQALDQVAVLMDNESQKEASQAFARFNRDLLDSQNGNTPAGE